MKTLSLEDGKLHLNSQGNIAVAVDAEGLRQKLETRLSLWLGEFWLDTSAGVPYLQRILGYGANSEGTGVENSVTQIINTEVLKEEEVLAIKYSSSTFNRATRSFEYSATVNTIYGVIEVEV